MRTLFSPYNLGDLRLPNRLVMAPMSRVRADEDGLANASMATYYAQRATAGLIISEGLPPSRVGRSTPGTPALYTAEHAVAWRTATDAVHANGGRIFAQIMHGGRISHPLTSGEQPVGPSAIAAGGNVFTVEGPQPFPTPRAIPVAEIGEHIAAHVTSSRLALQAGFDGVELHGANGYLIQQFLSSNANHRTDQYGGTIANRIRFAVETAAATAGAIGSDKVGIRLTPGGGVWDIEEADALELNTTLLKELARVGLAYVHVTGSVADDTLLALRRAWPATLIVSPSNPNDLNLPTYPAGDEARRWLNLGADLVSLGRAFLANPDLVERIRNDLPLNPVDVSTYYQGGDNGFLTYPTYTYAA